MYVRTHEKKIKTKAKELELVIVSLTRSAHENRRQNVCLLIDYAHKLIDEVSKALVSTHLSMEYMSMGMYAGRDLICRLCGE